MTDHDPWASTLYPTPAAPQSAYERALDAAGYGERARTRYIEESGDPETAECVWDEQIIPAAEASGEILEPPLAEPTLAETIRHWAESAAMREFTAQNPAYSPFDRDLTPQEKQRVTARTESLVSEHGDALAQFLRTTDRPQWREDDPAAQQAAAAHEQQILALFTTGQEPTA